MSPAHRTGGAGGGPFGTATATAACAGEVARHAASSEIDAAPSATRSDRDTIVVRMPQDTRGLRRLHPPIRNCRPCTRYGSA